MSVTALGDQAICGTLRCDTLDAKNDPAGDPHKITGQLEVTGDATIDGRLIVKKEGTFEKPVNMTVTAPLALDGYLMAGNMVLFDGLPTSDPNNEGQLWNNNGDVRISAGP
jgi:hypothetical protein